MPLAGGLLLPVYRMCCIILLFAAAAAATQICQWTLASAPGHPIFAAALHAIHSRLAALGPLGRAALNISQVVEVTGPAAFTDAVDSHIVALGHDWRELLGRMAGRPAQLGDLCLLPITAFSPGVGHMGAGSVLDPQAAVQHLFKGSWTNQRRRPQDDEVKQLGKAPSSRAPRTGSAAELGGVRRRARAHAE